MIASTARIIACATSFPGSGTEAQRPSLPSGGGRLGRYRDVREVEVGAAAGADLVVQLHDLAALGTLPAQLVALDPEEQRGHQPDERQEPGDQEPDPERRPLDLADDAAGKSEGEGDDQIGQRLRAGATPR